VKLNKLTLKDKKLFNQFLGLDRHELAVYVFENTHIWKGLFDIRWAVIEESLCIFFKDKAGCFLYLAPLGDNKDSKLVKKTFEAMDKFNKNKDISRIENIEAKDVPFYQDLGLDCQVKSYDYICARDDLVNLEGNKFKSKRSCFNYFIKHNKFAYLPFSPRHRDNCIELYNRWRQGRKVRNQGPLYCGMLEDTLRCLTIMFEDYQNLELVGRVVKIDGAIKAFTFGFKLNSDTFCILYEVADLSIKGLAQFIFRSFCGELRDYKYINIMDDSGLENLKRVKLSYHPGRLNPAYIAKRKNG
jgi:hypothetical protein